MKKNVGTIDAIIRISCGLVGLAWSASRSRRGFPFLFAMMSAMKVAEGITRYCPMLALFGKSTLSKQTDHSNPSLSLDSMFSQDQ
ncbi:YgaP family membrane protein [Hazenella coriacea]|uniref:DUF2892 family protein n=1 Tax=Hazenella coriacea TaxID=1179467 RepID=A0A4R3L2X2_9BACL|nr:DUF2892 domain-containing protein [Hazenella coriacea]TCS92793.1 DUF2892 family protein [Hazenella coriacea]